MFKDIANKQGARKFESPRIACTTDILQAGIGTERKKDLK